MTAMTSGELLQQLTRTLGAETASALMDRLPPAGARLVTRDDLLATREELTREIGELEQRMNARFDAVDHRFDAVDSRVGEAEHRLMAAMRGEIVTAITTQTRTMIFTMAGTVFSLMAFLVVFQRVAG
ncbi:MAG: hypothetical protein M3N57_08080 [Actinomycetota bacterium]|nr:hypothetical protein [Actinomycetota bacterium]